jgi:hypothetical protein
MNDLETIPYRGCTIRVVSDDHPGNPRKEFDHLATMVCWHGRYDLGDEQPKENAGDYLCRMAAEKDEGFSRLNDLYDEALRRGSDRACQRINRRLARERERVLAEHYVIQPLYLYEHSGITISTGSFSCPWDSGQVGFIFIPLETIRKEWPVIPDGLTIQQWAEKIIEGEVNEYDAYLTGDVVGVIAEDEEGEEIDSCWGYYPDEKGSHDYAVEDVKSAIDHHLERQAELATDLCCNI